MLLLHTDVVGHIKLNDGLDVGDVETSRGDIGRHQHRTRAGLELLESILSLMLRAVSMDGGGVDALPNEPVLEGVRAALRLDKYECEALALRQDPHESGAFLVILSELKALRDELIGGADAADRQEHVIAQEVAGELLDLTREGGAEHQRLTVL